jgi:hypothetical protein
MGGRIVGRAATNRGCTEDAAALVAKPRQLVKVYGL